MMNMMDKIDRELKNYEREVNAAENRLNSLKKDLFKATSKTPANSTAMENEFRLAVRDSTQLQMRKGDRERRAWTANPQCHATISTFDECSFSSTVRTPEMESLPTTSEIPSLSSSPDDSFLARKVQLGASHASCPSFHPVSQRSSHRSRTSEPGSSTTARKSQPQVSGDNLMWRNNNFEDAPSSEVVFEPDEINVVYEPHRLTSRHTGYGPYSKFKTAIEVSPSRTATEKKFLRQTSKERRELYMKELEEKFLGSASAARLKRFL